MRTAKTEKKAIRKTVRTATGKTEKKAIRKTEKATIRRTEKTVKRMRMPEPCAVRILRMLQTRRA